MPYSPKEMMLLQNSLITTPRCLGAKSTLWKLGTPNFIHKQHLIIKTYFSEVTHYYFKQKCTLLLTPLPGAEDINLLSHVISIWLLWNFHQWETGIQSIANIKILRCEREWRTGQENAVWSCVDFCLQPLKPLKRREKYNKSEEITCQLLCNKLSVLLRRCPS